MKTILFFSLLITVNCSFAITKLDLCHDTFKLDEEDKPVSLQLRACNEETKKAKIKKILVSSIGLRGDAMFNIVVNGDVKGTIYVPDVDPHYWVTIESGASSIEFVPLRGTARINNVIAYIEEDDNSSDVNYDDIYSDLYGHSAKNIGAKLSLVILRRIDTIGRIVTYKDYGKYILNIKKQATLAYAKSQASLDIDQEIIESLKDLYHEISYSKAFLLILLETDSVIDEILDLLAAHEEIANICNIPRVNNG